MKSSSRAAVGSSGESDLLLDFSTPRHTLRQRRQESFADRQESQEGFWCSLGGPCGSVRVRDQVDKREDDDPDNVDEVPVQPGDLDVEGLLRGESAAQGEEENRQEPGHTDCHVRAMEAGQDEEGRAKDVARETQAFVGEGGELEELTADEDRSEERGCRDPDAQPAVIAALNRRQ